MGTVLTAKKHEFAPGIKKEKPMSIMPVIDKERVFEFGVHDHEAVKSGRHYDLRLGDRKTGKAYSWAIPSAKLPAPGEKPVLAIPTFIHSIRYMDFEGVLGPGYGEGVVRLPHRSKAIVHYASPEKVKFSAPINGELQTYILFKPPKFKNAYLLMNVTKSEHKKEGQEAQQGQYLAPFWHNFKDLLPRYIVGTGAIEFGTGWGLKGLLKSNQGLAELAAKLSPKATNFILTRRPSLSTMLISSALLSGLHSAVKTYTPALRSGLRQIQGTANKYIPQSYVNTQPIQPIDYYGGLNAY
ncbi:MAG: DNA polymerase ligase N-terminal domain-containing protein [bacterium]